MSVSKILFPKLFPRKKSNEIHQYIEDEHIVLIVGSRQTGKTSLLYLLIQSLQNRKVSQDRMFYLNLEDFALLEMCNRNVDEFIAHLQGLGADFEQRNFVFIDEIQYLEHPTHFLKYIFDTHPMLKLIVTGSSSLEIRRKFKDSLAGRKVVFELQPLDFTEFLVFNGEEELSKIVERCCLRQLLTEKTIDAFPPRTFQQKLSNYFSQFVIFGGYPRIVREKFLEKKIVFLDELVQAYVRKDIKDLMRVDNVPGFNNLLKMLALQIGQLVNYAELSSSLKIARETVERYLFILENTFIIKRAQPFFSNRRKEVVKMPKVFFLDTGLRNALIKNYQELAWRPDAGALMENAVFANLYKNSTILEEIHFWRTQSKNEVDFVLLQKSPIPIEVKYRSFLAPVVPAGLRAFVKNYACEAAVVFSKDGGSIQKDKKLCTFFLPVWTA